MDGTKVETLFVEWRVEYAKFKQEMQQVRTELNTAKQTLVDSKTAATGLGTSFKSTLLSMLGLMALALAAIQGLKAAINGIKDAVVLAMDVTESENLFNTSLGSMSDSTRAWAKELSIALGVNDFEIRKVVGLWYTMTSSMGFTSDQALAMSKNLVQLKYDLMSFYNLDSERSDTIIKGMISGETEPAKQIGVILTDSMAKQALYRAGIAKEGEEIGVTTMAYGRYLSLMEQTSVAQGDMARTIDSPANALRVFQATLKDIQLSIGEAFLPIYQIAIPALQTFASFVKVVAEMVSSAFGSSGGRAGLAIQVGDVSNAAKSGGIQWSTYGNKAEEALKKTSAGVSKLRATILGFDELNVMQDNVTAAGGSAGALTPDKTGLPQGTVIPSMTVPTSDTTPLTKLQEAVKTTVDYIKDNWDKLKLWLYASPLGIPIAAAIDAIRLGMLLFKDSIREYDFLPDDISESTKAKLEPFLKLWNDTQATIKQWAWGNTEITDGMASGMAASFNDMATKINAALEEKNAKSLSVMSDFFDESSIMTDEEEAKALRKLSSDNAWREIEVNRNALTISAIYAKAAEEHRALTDEENKKVAELQDQMKSTAIETMSASASEQEKILRHLQVNSERISARQAADIVANSLAAKEQTINDAIDRCDQVIANAERMKEAGAIDEETYQKIVAEAEKQRDDTIAAAKASHEQVVAEAKLQAGDLVDNVNWETGEIKKVWQVAWDTLTKDLKTWGESWNLGWKTISDGLKKWYEDNIKPIFTSLGDGVRDAKQALTDFFNLKGTKFEVKTTIPTNDSTKKDLGISGGFFADGGFPDIGELYVARESGPEFVGSMGNRNVIANNDQIVSAVSQGVAVAVSAVLGNGSSGGGDIHITLQLDGQTVAKQTIKNINKLSMRAGRALAPGFG